MSDPIALGDKLHQRHLAEPLPDGDRGVVSRRVRCRFAVGSGPGFTDEMSSLLRTRLRLAILVLLVAFALHFLRNVLQLGPTYDFRPLWLFFSGCEIVVMVIASA